jgi:hypothetical protein
VRGPDGTLVASILGPAVMHEATELLRFEPDGTLVDSAPGATPASTSGPVPERYREPVLALVTLVALCWETHPRELVEP